MDADKAVKDHYGRTDIEERILTALSAAGKNPEHLVPEDLFAVDEFHIGGVEATREIAHGAGVGTGTYVLDIGCGLGGPARVFAHEFGATVHGVDLTPDFVRVGASLTQRSGLAGQVTFSEGSALELGFEQETFDVATVLHVGMNIEDKRQLFASAAKVLKPGGVLAVYDVMRMGNGEPTYPLPWAVTDDYSFVASPLEYSEAMEEAGFDVDSERNRLTEGISFIENAQAANAGSGPPALNLGVALGPDLRAAMRNLLGDFRAGTLCPVAIYAHRSN